MKDSRYWQALVLPAIAIVLGIVWTICAAAGNLQWLYPGSVAMLFLGAVGFQATTHARDQARRISSLEARLEALTQAPESGT